MDITLVSGTPLDLESNVLAIACDDEAPTENLHVVGLDNALSGALRRAMQDERFRGKPGQILTMHALDRLPSSRICLVGVGARDAVRPPALATFAGRAVRAANAAGASTVTLVPPALRGDVSRAIEALTAGALLAHYRFDRYLAEDKRSPRSVTVTALAASGHEATAAVARGKRIAAAIARARDLVNEPGGVMTPTRMAAVAAEVADANGLQLIVLGPKECADRGMGLFLAVAQGSTEEPRFVHLAYKPPGARKRVVLVGKGVTFDSGGLSLKPNDGMLDMKTDMAGAAAVISVMETIAQEKLPIEVHALAACTENMPSGRAYKLGDVLRSKAGKTVEINNTDAEGRLTLADAITYGRELSPDVVIDFATLTGACVVALGPHIAGVMSNDDALCGAWLDAASAVGEEMWRLPLPERLLEQLKSEVADMKNTGERWGGALTAGLFLKEFVGDVPWVHVDLAGPATSDKDVGPVAKGATGFAVATIFEYLRRFATT